MIIYQAQKSEFLHDVHHKDIEEVILDAYRARSGHKVSRQEIKVWASAHKTPLDAVVTTAFKGGQQQVNHPSYQAWSYAALLENFNAAVEDHAIRLSPCAYLHNYDDGAGDLLDPFYAEHLHKAPLFLKGERERQKLREFIKTHVRHGDQGRTLYDIEGGRIRPSRGLMDAVAGMLRGNPEFTLVDDQKLVFETALAQALHRPPAQGLGQPHKVDRSAIGGDIMSVVPILCRMPGGVPAAA